MTSVRTISKQLSSCLDIGDYTRENQMLQTSYLSAHTEHWGYTVYFIPDKLSKTGRRKLQHIIFKACIIDQLIINFSSYRYLDLEGEFWCNGKIAALWSKSHKFNLGDSLSICRGKATYIYTSYLDPSRWKPPALGHPFYT